MSKTHFLSTSILLVFIALIQICIPIWVSFVHSFSEKEILLQINQQWGNQPAMKTWISTTEPCHWPGIKCADGQSVNEISLNSQNIHGKVPPSICDLENLTVLNLGDNLIEGNFPTFLYNCTKLQHLNLSINSFVGRLPNDINNLSSKLQHLDLSDNNFTGSMEYLDLGMNDLVGEIPNNLANLGSMEHLNLGDNNLVGEIPSGLFLLKNLTNLILYINSLSGGIPTSMKALNLMIIDLSYNNLTGTIPEKFGKLSKLQILYLSSNQLDGTLPPSIGRLASLTTLLLNNNFFSGPLPPEMGLHSKLEGFKVNDNGFTGQLPEHLCSGGKLTRVQATNNYLNGTIPGSLGDCSTLSTIELSNNSLSGVLPPELGFHPKLEQLLVSGNKLSGEVPYGLFMASSIISLALNDNNFTGSIPNYKFSENLALLDLSNNKFSGIIPSRVFQCRNLSTFQASNNNFCGNIPVELTTLSSLTTLALDGNQLSGKLPTSIISCKSLIFLNLARNRLSGQLPEALGSLPNLYNLDLSHNNLSGEIPPKLAQLTKDPRQFALNLSSNFLTGEIPHALDNEEFQNSFFNNANLCTHNHISNLPQCSTSRHKYIILILLTGATIFMMFLYFTFFKVHIGKKEHNSCEQQEWKLKPFHRVEFTEKMILSGLNDNNTIGSGGSGKVYRVVVNDSGGKVAVKKIWNGRKLEGALEMQFSTEVEILGTIRHANIVKLLCYVSSAQDKLLVYEYVENQSLDKWLHRKMEGHESSSIFSETSMNSHALGILDWGTRLKIAIGAAKGLCYLHYGCSPSVVHRDIKSSNILLDSEFNAKIADFGLAMVAVKNGEPQTASGIKGSFGYIAPEYWRTKKLNVKIDVYSFGVVLLEMVTGKEACKGNDHLNLADWSWQWYCEERPIVDALDEVIKEPSVMEQMVSVFKLGLMCTNKNPVSRPNMKQVLQVLTVNSNHKNDNHPQTVNDE
ncbi:unnamed protein product [Amaranthus hypochondriacus]